EHSATALPAELDGLAVHGLWGRYEAGLSYLRSARTEPLTVGFLGINIANTLEPGDRFLVTADLVKPAPVLAAAYNDPPGASAQARFRLNQLAHFSRRFDGDVVLHRFYPRAHYV